MWLQWHLSPPRPLLPVGRSPAVRSPLGVHLPSLPRLQLLPGGSLQIDPVQVQDLGHYLCMASSPAGSDRRGVELHVLGKQESPADPSCIHHCRAAPMGAGMCCCLRSALPCPPTAPPAIAPGPSNLTLLAQQPATLGCDTWGSPEPHIRWEKDGRPLNLHLPPGAYRYLEQPPPCTAQGSPVGRGLPSPRGQG